MMTNDLHQLVFRFDPEGNWASQYHYGFGYWAVLAASLLFLALAIGKLLRQGCRPSRWRSRILPLLFCGGLLVYVAAYIKRVPLAWESDLTVNICILSVLFFEAALRGGLIPVNIQYQRLFASAPISLSLLMRMVARCWPPAVCARFHIRSEAAAHGHGTTAAAGQQYTAPRHSCPQRYGRMAGRPYPAEPAAKGDSGCADPPGGRPMRCSGRRVR